MFRRSSILIAGLAAAATVWAGGFFLTVRSRDNGLLVEAQGCRDYSQAKVTGRAEGIVNGKRQSVTLELSAGGKPGAYTVRKQWPAEGKWVLVFRGASGSLVTHTIVEFRPGGRLEPRMYMRPVTDAEVEAALANSGA
jgi:hypothetical protein